MYNRPIGSAPPPPIFPCQFLGCLLYRTVTPPPPPPPPPGADPGFRRGVSYIQKGGGGGVRTGISGADPSCCRVLGKSTSKKKLQTAVGGGPITPKKTLYPRIPPPPPRFHGILHGSTPQVVPVPIGLHCKKGVFKLSDRLLNCSAAICLPLVI